MTQGSKGEKRARSEREGPIKIGVRDCRGSHNHKAQANTFGDHLRKTPEGQHHIMSDSRRHSNHHTIQNIHTGHVQDIQHYFTLLYFTF